MRVWRLIIVVLLLIGTTGANAGEVRLVHFYPVERDVGNVLAEYVQEFKSQTGVPVSIEAVGYAQPFIDKVITQVAGGVAPDIIVANDFTFPYHKELLTDLNPYIKASKFRLDEYFRPAVDAFTGDGKVYMIPHSVGAIAFYYNIPMFNDSGVAAPLSGWTIAQWVETLRTLSHRSAGDEAAQTSGAGFTDPSLLGQDIWWLWTHGVEVLDKRRAALALDSPEGVRALNAIAELVDRGLVDTRTQGAQWTAGRLGMVTQGPWMIKQWRVPFEFGVLPVPHDQTQVTSVFSNGWGILSDSRQKETAWQFISYMQTRENQLRMAYYQAVPHIRAATDAGLLSKEPLQKAFLDVLAHGRAHTLSRAFIDVRDQVLGKAMNTIVQSRTAAPSVALSQVRSSVEAILAAYGPLK